MAGPLFRSALASRLEAFLRTRCVGSRGQHTRKILRYLDQFLTKELTPGQTINSAGHITNPAPAASLGTSNFDRSVVK